MRKNLPLKILASAIVLSALFISCTKTGTLTGGTGSGSFGNSMNGSVNGGLSPIAGALVSLYVAGNATPIANATTASNGSYNLVYNNPGGTSYFYLTIAGGNAGGGTNSNIKLLALAGTAQSPQTQVSVNEFSTAAAQLVGTNFGLLQDANGTVTFKAAASQSGSNNVATQTANFMNINLGTLNSGNSNVTTAMTNGLYTMANAFASCIENSSKCATLFNNAVTSASAAAINVLDAGVNMLGNSANVSSNVYTLAFPFNSTTGFTLSSSTMPGGFSFNNALATTTQSISALGPTKIGIAADASGNLWAGDLGSSFLDEVNSAGTRIAHISTSFPEGVAIDSSGNIWIVSGGGGNAFSYSPSGVQQQFLAPGLGNLNSVAIGPDGSVWVSSQATSIEKFSASGTLLGTFTVGSNSYVFIDGSGNVWTANRGSNTVTELNSSGTALSTISVGSNPTAVAFDPSGNVWVSNRGDGTVMKLSSLGTVLKTFTIGDVPAGIAIDQVGNLFIANLSNSIDEMNSSGTLLAKYGSAGTNPFSIAIDPSGNVWTTNADFCCGRQGFMISGVANGPQFFPYSGPIFPYSSF